MSGSIETLVAALVAALDRNSSLLERVIAGQEAAMAALASGGTGGAKRTPRAKKDDETPAGTTEGAGNAAASTETSAADSDAAAASPAATTAPTAETPAATAPVGVAAIVAGIGTDPEKLKAHIMGWTGSTEDAAEKGKRVELLKAIAASFGVAPKFTDLIPHAAKAVFLVERAKALGVDKVDVAAAYDFDGDPSQEVAEGSDF